MRQKHPQKRVKLNGGRIKDLKAHPAKILRIKGHDILFRVVESDNGESIQILGEVGDKHIGEFDGFEFAENVGKWVEVRKSTNDDEPHLFSYEGPDELGVKRINPKPQAKEYITEILRKLGKGEIHW